MRQWAATLGLDLQFVRQVILPFLKSPVHIDDRCCGDFAIYATVQFYRLIHEAKQLCLMARCGNGKTGTIWHLPLIPWLSVEAPDILVSVYLDILESGVWP